MTRDWEDTFRAWAAAPSQTEQDKQENAERMIRDGIRESDDLSERKIRVRAQGSYRNHTNVRLESDVDIYVLCLDLCRVSYPEGLADADVGLVNAEYSHTEFKNHVENALVAKFGQEGVTRGNKAFDVHENTYRVDADVVACIEHRRYYKQVDSRGQYVYESGTQFWTDHGSTIIINWPEHHYDNGVQKNSRTGHRFKAITRVLKRLRNEMEDQGVAAAKSIPSYLIECLVWNAPDDGFGHERYTADVRSALAYLFNETLDAEKCREWGEVNELKYLFRDIQPWTRAQAHGFLSAAWDYIGFD